MKGETLIKPNYFINKAFRYIIPLLLMLNRTAFVLISNNVLEGNIAKQAMTPFRAAIKTKMEQMTAEVINNLSRCDLSLNKMGNK